MLAQSLYSVSPGPLLVTEVDLLPPLLLPGLARAGEVEAAGGGVDWGGGGAGVAVH